jgi:hypothetical protein
MVDTFGRDLPNLDWQPAPFSLAIQVVPDNSENGADSEAGNNLS